MSAGDEELRNATGLVHDSNKDVRGQNTAMDGKVSGWLDAEMARSDELAVSPEAMRFSRSMKGTLTQDVSSASSTKDGNRRGKQ